MHLAHRSKESVPKVTIVATALRKLHGNRDINHSMSVVLSYEQAGRIARLTLNRPEAKNALRPADWQQLLLHVDDIARKPEVHVVWLSGSGGAFSSGVT